MDKPADSSLPSENSKKSAGKIFSASLGTATIRALYIEDGEITSSVGGNLGDLPQGITLATESLEKKLGHKIKPDQVVISGREEILRPLREHVAGVFVSEEQAIRSAEEYLTKKFSSPTALLDLGPSAFADYYPASDISRWLPFVTNLTDIENYLANKRLFPRTLPLDAHEYELDLAVARQAIISLGTHEGKTFLPIEESLNLVLTGGLLTLIPKVPDLMSVFLDSSYCKSGVTVFLDRENLLLPLGGALYNFPETRLEVSLTQIGSVLHLGGSGKIAIDFGWEDKQSLSLESGEILVLPAEEGKSVTVTVGTKVTRSFALTGGEGGIYLDHRERPLPLSSGSKDSIAKVTSWRKMLAKDSLVGEVSS